MSTVWIILGVLLALGVIAVPVIRGIAAKKKAGDVVGWLDVALMFAQGIDDAKALLSPEAKAQLGGALKDAAEKVGKHDDVTAFLNRFGFNKKPTA